MLLDLQVVVLYLFKLLLLASKVVLQTSKFVSRVSSSYELMLFKLMLLQTFIDDFGLFKLLLLGFIASSSQVDYLCYLKLLLFASKSKFHISCIASLFSKNELPSS
ncbi:hypothetical protein ACJIZ3_012709 [Penstemon smallii]|uniref:Uncharacterized protein n=1 Tax=Penstemon smallii TaxID=265156 RepID=A0ABD3UNY1_9LAMI